MPGLVFLGGSYICRISGENSKQWVVGLREGWDCGGSEVRRWVALLEKRDMASTISGSH